MPMKGATAAIALASFALLVAAAAAPAAELDETVPCSRSEINAGGCINLRIDNATAIAFRFSDSMYGAAGAAQLCAKYDVRDVECAKVLKIVKAQGGVMWMKRYKSGGEDEGTDIEAWAKGKLAITNNFFITLTADARRRFLTGPSDTVMSVNAGDDVEAAVERYFAGTDWNGTDPHAFIHRDQVVAALHSQERRKMQGKRRYWLLLEQESADWDARQRSRPPMTDMDRIRKPGLVAEPFAARWRRAAAGRSYRPRSFFLHDTDMMLAGEVQAMYEMHGTVETTDWDSWDVLWSLKPVFSEGFRDIMEHDCCIHYDDSSEFQNRRLSGWQRLYQTAPPFKAHQTKNHCMIPGLIAGNKVMAAMTFNRARRHWGADFDFCPSKLCGNT